MPASYPGAIRSTQPEHLLITVFAATVLIARNIVGQAAEQSSATNALVLVVGDHTGILVLIQRTCGTHVYAARIGAMLTSTAAKCPANALLGLLISKSSNVIIKRVQELRSAGW